MTMRTKKLLLIGNSTKVDRLPSLIVNVRADVFTGMGEGHEIFKKRPDISILVVKFSSGRFRSSGEGEGSKNIKNQNVRRVLIVNAPKG